MGKVWALAAGVDESRHSKTISWCVNFLAARDAKPVTSQSRVDSNWTGSDAVPSDGIDEVCCNDADGARMARIRVWTRTIDSMGVYSSSEGACPAAWASQIVKLVVGNASMLATGQ
uniref:Uncharacterized protein n=1 Tax=Coccidioides posadasii RMSCC 3488 TaxID=454284 RepID=A0A0J6FJH7_COCPO|nr:hypothetical protein CPAG_05870 [Coccidioides posadasii RMSCC 3488]